MGKDRIHVTVKPKWRESWTDELTSEVYAELEEMKRDDDLVTHFRHEDMTGKELIREARKSVWERKHKVLCTIMDILLGMLTVIAVIIPVIPRLVSLLLGVLQCVMDCLHGDKGIKIVQPV